MTIRKLSTGKWICECYPNGRTGKRIRKQFATKGETLAFERFIMEEVDVKPWLGEKRDNRTLSDLVEIWAGAYGVSLNGYQNRLKVLMNLCRDLGDPKAVDFDAKAFSRYREKRLKGEILRGTRKKGVSPRTLNIELAYLRAVFNELMRCGEWKKDNPLKNIRLYSTTEQEMSFLTKPQVEELLNACARSTVPELSLVVKICLATGARWSEAEKLTRSQVIPHKVTFTKTKGKRNRSVPIREELYNQLPQKSGRLFPSCYAAFRSALKRTSIKLPARQSSHVLRHTFASFFMMNGGNILVLQRVLGHTDIKMTMRYSHFSPEHLEDAIRYNPLMSV
ncbi:tyrosine-type recombinase/integrase [Sodalis sp. dw_96]|uniref:phage integrase n=1 Tax=Sodalis sp. dw_96 TaxID=2719794 RepID=UPI001BD541CE|nr:tyrosine-type recombinase/integrase [Sodalis sp. dw_96]